MLCPATRFLIQPAAAELDHFCFAKIGTQTVLAKKRWLDQKAKNVS
jgi:hypothetical protein